jgi:hypothetical protein
MPEMSEATSQELYQDENELPNVQDIDDSNSLGSEKLILRSFSPTKFRSTAKGK